MTLRRIRNLKRQGREDAELGLPITSFYGHSLQKLGLKHYTKKARAIYEIGYRAAKKMMEKNGRAK